MKKINKIILIFFVLCFTVLYGGWLFIHSDKFSTEASMKVSKILTQEMGIDLNFSGVEFSLFPLATTFKNVKLLKNDPNLLNLTINTKELVVSFKYSSFLKSVVEINDVEIKDGSVYLNLLKESNNDFNIDTLKTEEVFESYLEVYSKLPVMINNLSLKNIDLDFDDIKTHINEINLSPSKTKIQLDADLTNFTYKHQLKDVSVVEVDSIIAKASIRSEAWRLEYLNVKDESNDISLKGIINNERNGLNLKSTADLKINAKELVNHLPGIPKEIKEIEGDFQINVNTYGLVKNQSIEMQALINNLKSPYIKLENVEAKLSKFNDEISLIKLKVKNKEERYELRKSETFFNIKKNKFTNFKFQLKVKDAFTNTFLYAIDDILRSFKGNVSGNLYVDFLGDKINFGIKEEVEFENFHLTTPDEKQDILKNSGFKLKNTNITLHHDMTLGLDANLIMKNGALSAKGKIGEHGLDIKTQNSKIDLSAFGPIASVALRGAGPFDLHIHGPFENVLFDFDVNWNDFSVVDINLGKIQAKFSFEINNLLLDIDSLKGVYNQTEFTGKGLLGFDHHNEGMDLKVDIKKGAFSDVRNMLGLIFNNLKNVELPELFFQGSYDLKGGYDLEKLDIRGNVRGIDFKYFHEEAERVSLDLTLVDSILSVEKVKLYKSRGELNAVASLNLKNDYLSFSGSTYGLRLKDFNFYKRLKLEYDGDFNVDFEGAGNIKRLNSKFTANIDNAFIGNTPVASSNAVLYLNSDEILMNTKVLGGKIKADSLINFSTGVAAIKAGIDTDDIPELLGIISGHNISDRSVSGSVKAELMSQISLGNLGVRKFNLNIDDFNIKKGDINLVIDPRFNKVIVEDGIVKNWNLKLNDGKNYIKSIGKNISNGVILVDHDFSIRADVIEIFVSQIERARGKIVGNLQLKLDKKISVQNLFVNGDDQSFKIRNVPGNITDLNYKIKKDGDDLELSNLLGRYGEGDFRVSGRVNFKDFYPQMNFQYQVEKSRIPLFKRSSLIVSSIGLLNGKAPPYKLSGKLSILHGEILDDPTDMLKDNKVSIDEYKKFLPEKNTMNGTGMVNLDLLFNIESPIVVKNNMAEVYVKGNGLVSGEMLSPEFATRLETLPGVSKFKFKGHDFILSQGFVEVRDRGKNRFSELKFTGAANISEYAMKLDLSGSVSNVNIDLSSEPALSKEDLLSLLALGVTSDMSKNLEATERRFVTTVGIGTLLVDQLKINEDLNSTLGLKLSVVPEFKEDETALIQGKSAQSDGSTSRLKSATKIKINKKINDRVDVSVSSTVGGSLEQKQEMNINFNINKNFSLEGVYEVKPNEDENGITPNSVGADLKWRKSF